jgi:Double zinc ribbon/zinc-ribbon domain
MRCPNCGTEITGESHFCMECGFRVTEKEVVPALKQEPQAPAPSSPPSNQRSTSSSVYCPMCGIENASQDSFCKMCGANLKVKVLVKCDACGVELPKDDKYCPNCGTQHGPSHRHPTPPAGMAPVSNNPTPPAGMAPVSNNNPPPPMVKENTSPENRNSGEFIKIAGVPAPAPSDKAAKTIYQIQPSRGATTHGRTLKVIKGERLGEKFPFTQSMVIGKTHGEIIFPSDEYLDARHIGIDVTPRGVHIKDLDTVNGVFYHLNGEYEVGAQSMFFLGDHLFIVEELTASEWSLNGVWERGVKLMGSLKNQSPWCRLRLLSPLGTTSAIYLLWKEEEIVGDSFLPGAGYSDGPTCKIVKRNRKIYVQPMKGDVYVKIHGEQEFSLPIRLRCGLESFEITSF